VILSDFVVVSLAVFSITYLAVYFDGPFGVLWKIRRLCGVKRVPILNTIGQEVDIVEEARSGLAKFVKCHWCFTTWISLVVFSTYIILAGVDVVWFPFLWMAGVAISGLLHDYSTK